MTTSEWVPRKVLSEEVTSFKLRSIWKTWPSREHSSSAATCQRRTMRRLPGPLPGVRHLRCRTNTCTEGLTPPTAQPTAPQGHQPTPRKLAGPASASAASPPPPLPFQPALFPHSCPSHGKGAGREQHLCQVTRTALLTPHKCFTRVPLTQRPMWGGSAPGTQDSVCRSFQWGQASEAAP